MIAFVIAAAVMAALALAWILVPLLRKRGAASVDRDQSNLEILRSQRAELESDLANGTITEDQYEATRVELDRRVLEEARVTDRRATPATPPRAGTLTAGVIAAALPLAAVALYVMLGTPNALNPDFAQQQQQAQDASHQITPEELQAMTAKLAEKLQAEPGNAEGWAVLARTYYVMGKPQEAVKAYERAAQLLPEDANLFADYADALGIVQGRTLEGKPLELAERAIKLNPRQWKALALAGTAAFNRKDYRKAVDYWERARDSVPPTSPFAQSIDASIAEARELGGMAPVAASGAPMSPADAAAASVARALNAPSAASSAAPAAAAAPVAGGATIVGTVTLSPALAKVAQPDDAVYIFARPAQGSRAPLALTRKQVKDLPASFTLDDSMAMTPEMKLSTVGEVVVVARISKSGSAMPQSGDLEGASPAVKVGTSGLALVIDKTVP